MPLDAGGNYRHNHESAQMHSQASGKKYNAGGDNAEKQEESGEHTEVHDHGDGTFHTVHPEHGEMEHESIGHMHAHLSKIHGEEGHSHFHGHHDGAEMHSHSVKSGEEPESRDHEDVDGMHDHMQEAMGGGEEDHDANPEEEQQHPAGAGLSGLY